MSFPIGDWSWDRQTARLTLQPQAGTSVEPLSGIWQLSDLARVLDGLSAAHLKSVFANDVSAVSCELVLAEGQRLNLIGGVDAEGGVSGILLSDQDETVNPGSKDHPPLTLAPVYQPIFDITGQRIAGFEALARWHGDQGTALDYLNDRSLAPNMLIEAVNALATWRQKTGRDSLYVQVNVTAQDLGDAHFPDLISALMTGYDLPDGALRLELTEHAALRDSLQVIEIAKVLRERGVRLVLDDFGSGHSSFLWLAHLPADALKIDAALIAELNNLRVQAILSMVTDLAQALGLLSVAEGVEDRAMLPVLEELGFTHVQGFGLARPVSAADALDVLR